MVDTSERMEPVKAATGGEVMSFLGRLFGGGKTKPVDQPAVALECPHTALVPKWDNVHDMGIEDKATGYECDSCHKAFTP